MPLHRYAAVRQALPSSAPLTPVPLGRGSRRTYAEQMNIRLLSALALLATVPGAGCSTKPDAKPPYADPCGSVGATCVGPVRVTSGVPTVPTAGGGGVSGTGGQPGTSGKAVAVSGKVELYRDEQFTSKSGFGGQVTISADGAMGTRVNTLYLGNGVFRFEVKEATANWFSAKPDGGQDALTTLFSFNTQALKTTDIVLARSSAVDSVFAQAPSRILRSDTAAHVVLNVVDANNLPLLGVAVAAPTDTLVAYAIGVSWASNISETTALGRAFVGNIPAANGVFRDVTLELSGTLVRQVPVRVLGGAVSVLTVRP